MITVQRNPFARGEHARFCDTDRDCDWCGQRRRRVFGYVWQTDSLYRQASESDVSHWFCNFGCFSDYHGS